MFGKNRKKKVGLCVMVVTSCFILAALWAVLATPETALAKGKPPPKDKDDGGKETRTYLVTFKSGSGEVAASGSRTMSIINPEDSVAHLHFDNPLDLSGVILSDTRITPTDFNIYFPTGAKADMMHGLFRDKHDPAKVNGILFFKGVDKTGKQIGYRIDYTGDVTGETWTPPEGGIATITLVDWELKADTGGRKNALSGEGSFSGSPITTILVERLPNP